MGDPAPLYSVEGLAVEVYDCGLPDSDKGPIGRDIDFYRNLARDGGEPVLELGAGTGRVSWALAAEGIDIVGLDRSRPMLARAEAKRGVIPPEVGRHARFVEGDMTGFSLDCAFGLAIAPFRAFQSLLTPQAQRKSLLCIHRHLRPGGRLALHIFDPRLEFLLPDSDAPMMRGEIKHPDTDNTVRREITQRTTDPLTQIIGEIWDHREIDGAGTALRHEEACLELRWTYRWEMRYLLELCGFEVEAEYSDFERSPPAYGLEQVWVARRP